MNEIRMLIATCMFCGLKYEKTKLGEDEHRCKEMEEGAKEIYLDS